MLVDESFDIILICILLVLLFLSVVLFLYKNKEVVNVNITKKTIGSQKDCQSNGMGNRSKKDNFSNLISNQIMPCKSYGDEILFYSEQIHPGIPWRSSRDVFYKGD